MISKVLVANRGEIARRIFRTCREMGISTVAIYSEADANEPHAREADEAVMLPGNTSAETYLNISAVIEAAKDTGADAVHPGYGFLSENPSFARLVQAADLIWVGPSPDAIETMGSKLRSKKVMEEAGVPTLASVEVEGSSITQSAALSLGLPVLVKASAGGGGKGMRVVESLDNLKEAVEEARGEAASSFGDDTVFLEKYLTSPKHIEIQVFGDNTGRIISLNERECSIQRRHQKVIEEAPSPIIDPKTREAMGEAAITAAAAVDYVGAGTVEFLYQDDEFYFLEMNTRIQVEHAVTEMTTGLDLVRLQFEVADGKPLPDEIPPIDGHAIEARLYAEDPMNNYLPVTGKFHRFRFPDTPGLRVDAGIDDGSTVSVYYDPMIAKVIAHAPTRVGASAALVTALQRAEIHGPGTNRALLVRILQNPVFVAGEMDTNFLEKTKGSNLGQPLLDESGEKLAALAAALSDQAYERESALVLTTIPPGWRNSPSQKQHRAYQGHFGRHDVEYSSTTPFVLDWIRAVTGYEATSSTVSIRLDDAEHRFSVTRYDNIRYVDSKFGTARLEALPRFAEQVREEAPGSLQAPMPGTVLKVTKREGDVVFEGEAVVVIEAMKMEHTLRAPRRGTVSEVLCSTGDQVEANTTLMVIDET